MSQPRVLPNADDQQPADSTHESVHTEGGTYIAGNASADDDLIGRDKNTFNNSVILHLNLQAPPTPNELNTLLQSVPTIQQGLTAFSNLIDPFPELRDPARGLCALLEYSRQQMRRINEYKGSHDRLQRLEGIYRLLAPEIYDFGRLIDTERANWKRLRDLCGAVERAVEEVYRHGNEAMFADSARSWLELLFHAANLLRQGYELRDLQLIDAGAQDIYDVMSGRITEMNNRLVEAVDSLNFPGLIRSLYVVQQKLTAESQRLTPKLVAQLAAFSTGLSGLEAYSAALLGLCRSHYAWQESYDLLSGAQDQLSQNPNRLASRWERIIKSRLQALCEIETHPGARVRLIQCSDQLTNALAANVHANVNTSPPSERDDMDDIEGALYDLREAVTSRFCEIDHDLLRICDQLREAGGPLDTVLEKLR